MHCVVDHWGGLSYDQLVMAMNWRRFIEDYGLDVFREAVGAMQVGSAPLSRGAIIVAAAVFDRDLELLGWVKQRLKKQGWDPALSVALLYALVPFMRHDDDLADWLLVFGMKLPKEARFAAMHSAVQDALSIWRSCGPSGTCEACGRRRG